MAEKKNTAARARELVEPIAAQLGLRLWDVCYEKEGASFFLRVLIDRDGGVGIDDCEAMHRAIDAPLDEADLVSGSYYLEVSSPGLFRELKRAEHFEATLGSRVRVKLIRPLEGEREFVGQLTGYESDTVCITTDAGEQRFARGDIAKVTVEDDI